MIGVPFSQSSLFGITGMLCEKHAALALAKAGIRESIIEKTLTTYSTEARMKDGLAKEVASEAIREGKETMAEAAR